MRPGVIPGGIVEGLAMLSGQVPTPLVRAAWGMGEAQCLISGARLGIFGALADGPRTADELAETLACHPVGLGCLLDALNGFGWLRRSRPPVRFSLSRPGRRWLIPGGRRSLHHGLCFMGDLYELLVPLEEAVRSGSFDRLHERELPAELWERYLRALGELSGVVAPLAVRAVRFAEPPRRLLDVGGGHGRFSAAFCARYPGLEATVLDLPPACRVGRELVAGLPGAERVTFREQDMREGDWGEDFDVVLLFNVLHNATAEEGEAAIASARTALRSGGRLLVMDSEHRERGGNLSTASGFNEILFFVLSGARAWPEATMRSWFDTAGFGKIRTLKAPMMPLVVMSATAP